MGIVLLAGGAEFGGQMADADRRAVELAGGVDVPIRIIPAAAAPDNNHQRAGENGVNWFKSLGATDVCALPLIDPTSASDPAVVEALSQARLIYLLGGFPGHLAQSLQESRGWQAAMEAYQAGAVIAGSSAGAMVLCEHFYSPRTTGIVAGLGLIEGLCILPHHDTFGKNWAASLQDLLPDDVLLGIDEETGVICHPSEGLGKVHGKGEITSYHGGRIDTIGSEQEFSLGRLKGARFP